MEQQAHFFYAIKISEKTKILMNEHIENLKKTIQFGRWVHYEDLHITLAFLGNAPEVMLKKSINIVSDAVKELKPFKLQINTLGTFGSMDSPRIFWVDTMESEDLLVLRERVFNACEAAGFQLETRPFRPHITIARKWMGEEPFHHGMLDIWKELQTKPLIFEASYVVLYQTHLKQSPKYEEKQIFRIGKG